MLIIIAAIKVTKRDSFYDFCMKGVAFARAFVLSLVFTSQNNYFYNCPIKLVLAITS